MDVKVVDVEVFRGDVLITFSDGKISVCRAEEIYRYASSPEMVSAKMRKETLPES